MSPQARSLVLLFLTSTLVGCDRSSDYEGCVYSDDPGLSPGSRRSQCPPSVFPAEDSRSRDVSGVVHRGADVVPGAFVRVEPWPGFEGGTRLAATSTITDGVGFFGGIRPVSLRYDLSVRIDQDVLVYRGVAARWLDPAIEDSSRPLPRAWTAHVDVHLYRPIPEGHTLAFFASGDGIFGVRGDAAAGLSVYARDYSLPATLHALEYETAGGLETAVAYAKADVALDAGVSRLVSFSLEEIASVVAPLPSSFEPQFTVTAPPGFSASAVEVRFGYTPTSDARLAIVPVGSTRKLPVIPNAGFTYRAIATADGAVSDSGEVGFDAFHPIASIVLPEVPTAASPSEGETRAVGESLLVDGEGVFEHVLLPQAGGPAMRIITAQRDASLPDLQVLGSAPATGPYTWTVRSYPSANFVEAITGSNARRYRSMAASKPRSIVLR